MNRLSTIFALMVAMLATSCQQDDLGGLTGPEQDADVAYVSLKISSAKQRAAESEGDDGTKDPASVGDESKIFSLALVAFDYNYDYIDAYEVRAEGGKFNCKVAPSARRFFAVVNPNTEIWTAINAVSSLSQSAFSALPAITMTAASVSTENNKSDGSGTRGFTMVNCGVKNPEGILLESLVSISTELSEDADNPTPVEITVDRMVAKFEYSVGTNFVANTTTNFGEESSDYAVGEVLGVALTATNRATNLYSMVLMDTLTNNNVYRTDHNMTVGQTLTDVADIRKALTDNFYWLTNEDEATDNAFVSPNATAGSVATTPEYVLENTCLPAYSNSNNLTQAIVKATYNPRMTTTDKPLALGTSWYKMYTTTGDGTLYLTFDEVKDVYNASYVGFTATTETKKSMDVQLNKILGTTGKTWGDADVTNTLLDDAPYGGYKAATVPTKEDYVLQFYQKGVNYYDIFIQHDDSQPIGKEGRWGMVRNNSYRMDISGIMKEGLPYIPDPTDPEIVDPENQDPKDPEPADKLETYISVSITPSPWVLWFQESPLQ